MESQVSLSLWGPDSHVSGLMQSCNVRAGPKTLLAADDKGLEDPPIMSTVKGNDSHMDKEILLLMLHFGRLDRTIIIMASLPFGMIGGLWAVYLAGYNLSVAVAVGFIALGGIAVETAVIMLLYLDARVRENPPETLGELAGAVIEGAVMRVRPKLMTVSTILVGLAPIFITSGLGADIMRRIALPMLGGMISTLLLTLVVIPVIYYIWVGKSLQVRSHVPKAQ